MSFVSESKTRLLSLTYGFVSDKGKHRSSNEDVILVITDFLTDYRDECQQFQIRENPFALFAIFDGHGGNRASLFASKHLPRLLLASSQNFSLQRGLSVALAELDQLILKQSFCDGTTALIVLITPDGRYAVANIGDSEGLIIYEPLRLEDCESGLRPLIRKEPLYPFLTHNLAVNAAERERITRGGGELVDQRLCLRCDAGFILGMISISRALGDRQYKNCTPLSSVPEIVERTLTGFESYLVLACDGLWDVFCADEVFEVIETCQRQQIDLVTISQILVNLALEKGSTDNVSVIIIKFEGDEESDSESDSD